MYSSNSQSTEPMDIYLFVLYAFALFLIPLSLSVFELHYLHYFYLFALYNFILFCNVSISIQISLHLHSSLSEELLQFFKDAVTFIKLQLVLLLYCSI